MAKPADKSTAIRVIRKLRKAGFEALLAGGCVRDMLLGVRCTDYDIATSATPDQVKELFGNVLLIGARFGVAMVIAGGRIVEVATFRSDLSYSDGRHPDAVKFSTAREDALRRDFTINGMFCDPLATGGGVIDYVGGRDDLKRGMIRTIGDPNKRFGEDYLRMVRAVRFSARLGFPICPATAAAICAHAGKITSVSGERILDELTKMLGHPSAAEAMAKLHELTLARRIAPELFGEKNTWPAAVARVAAIAKKGGAHLALGAMLAELPAEQIRRMVKRWGGPNWLRDECIFLADHLDDWSGAAEMPLCDFKRLMAGEHFDGLRLLWRIREQKLTGHATQSRRIARRVGGIPADSVAPTPLVTGADLVSIGLSEGPKLGRLLKSIYDAQLNEQITTHGQGMAMARQVAGD